MIKLKPQFTSDSLVPVSVSGINNAISVTSSGGHTCAVLDTGIIKCWGWNLYGMLGNGSGGDFPLVGDDGSANQSTPVSVVGITNAVDVAAGGSHTFAVLSDGTVRAWGNITFSHYTDYIRVEEYTPVPVEGITNAVAIATGSAHACVLLNNGSIQCWGDNGSGGLGTGTEIRESITPVYVEGITNATKIVVGGHFSCALLSDATVKCWGHNSYGNLGDGTTTSRYSPVFVSGISNVRDIAAGMYHARAVLSDNTVKCWGLNWDGEVGDGTTTHKLVPVNVLS